MHEYTPSNIDALLALGGEISGALGREHRPSDTLVTKIMLGVFGNVPAFDNNFVSGFRAAGLHTSGFGRRSLKRVKQFYDKHADLIDTTVVFTCDFRTGESSGRRYTRAKLIDMVFFVEGMRVEERKRKAGR